MAGKKARDKQAMDPLSAGTGGVANLPNVQADHNSIALGSLHVDGDVTGAITIGHGYTAEQVSLLLKQITTTLQPKPFDGRCPYKGLDVFEEEDAELFFGRERLVKDLLSRVQESRAVFITGPSGSGKSSLVRAGLLHALRKGALKNSERWLYETMKPGREPVKDLALAFSRLKGPDLADYFQAHAMEPDVLHKCAESALSGRKDQRFVLFVDQFEEIFTQVSQEEERLAFIHMLAYAATVENGRLIVLFAMRSDFVSNCAAYPALNELLSQEFRQIGAMQPEELVSAIALPARHVGLPVEDELIARIINDMKGEPGALPLMQFALKDLFDARQEQGGVIALTLEDYLRHGGIHKSLERHADSTFARLGEDEQQLARSIFGGLIEIGRGTVDTRRTALFDELVPANTKTEDVLIVVQKLADARLVITDEQAGSDTVTISHEKLIDAWPWLKKLVSENRDAIALQNSIAADAKEWQDNKQDESYLYTGARLANAREQLEANKIRLGGLAQTFVDASLAAVDAERQREEERRQKELDDAHRLAESEAKRAEAEAQRAEEQTRSAANLRKRSFYLTVALMIALVSIGAAVWSSIESRKQARIAGARETATQAILQRDKDFLLSLLLGVEAFQTMDLPVTRGALLDNAAANPRLIQHLAGHRERVYSVAFSPDGKILASGSWDNTVILWDVGTQQQIGEPLRGHSNIIMSVAFSPDGKILASASWDETIILWDVETQQPIGEPLQGQGDFVMSVAFSPDGKTLASGGYNYTIILWDVATHQPIGEPLQGHRNSVHSVAFSPDGKTLASGGADLTVILWDVATQKQIGEPLRGYSSLITSVAFSPDGKTLASGSWDNTVILWDVGTQQPIGEPLQGHSDDVYSVVFSPDGKILASASWDETIILWNIETRQPIGEPLQRHSDSVYSVAFSPDGQTLASGSADQSIILWNMATQQPIGEPLQGHSNSVFSAAFSPDGKTLASGSWDETIILWNIETRQPIGEPLQRHSDSVYSVAFSPDGQTLASGSADQSIILWNMATQQPIGEPLQGHSNSVFSAAFSPDGKTLASGSADKTIILWDVGTQQQIGEPLQGHSEAIPDVVFSPDGKTLASVSYDKTIILWDVAAQRQIGEPLQGHSNRITSAAFSPDGKTMALGSGDHTIILWNIETRQQMGEPLRGHSNSVYTVAFSPDGKTMASGSGDHTIILWNIETRQQMGEPLRGHSNDVWSVAFSPDGKILASGSADHTVILWDVGTQQPVGEPLQGHGDFVMSVAFSPDGKSLASGSDDHTIILWDIDPQSWVEKSCQRAGRNFSRAEWAQYFPGKEYHKTCPQWPLEQEAAQ